MTLADLLRETLDVDCDEVWENERTPTPVRVFRVRLYSMGLSVRQVEGVLAWLGVDRCYQAVWNWKEKLAETQSDPPTAAPSRVAVDEKLRLGNVVFLGEAVEKRRRGVCPAAAVDINLQEQFRVRVDRGV